jgi:hypothetical protein
MSASHARPAAPPAPYGAELRRQLREGRTRNVQPPGFVLEAILETWHRLLYPAREAAGRRELLEAETAVLPHTAADKFLAGHRLALFRRLSDTPPSLRTPPPDGSEEQIVSRIHEARNDLIHLCEAPEIDPAQWDHLETAIHELEAREREIAPPHPEQLARQAARVRDARDKDIRTAARLAGGLLERMLHLLYLEIAWRASPEDRAPLLRHEAKCKVDSLRRMNPGPLCALFQRKLPDGKTLSARFLNRPPWSRGRRLRMFPNQDLNALLEIRHRTKSPGTATETAMGHLVATVLAMHADIVENLDLHWPAPPLPEKSRPVKRRIAAFAAFAVLVGILSGGFLLRYPSGPELPDIAGTWEDPERYRYVIREVDKNRYQVVSVHGFGGEFYPLLESGSENGVLEWIMEVPWNESRIDYRTVSIAPDRIEYRWKSERGEGADTLRRVDAP